MCSKMYKLQNSLPYRDFLIFLMLHTMWAQSYKMTKTTFGKSMLFCHEVTFHLCRGENQHNVCIWRTENQCTSLETAMLRRQTMFVHYHKKRFKNLLPLLKNSDRNYLTGHIATMVLHSVN